MRFRTRALEDPGIDVTPLVDVVFQLLIYFAVSTTFAFLGAMKVNLPKAGTAIELTASQKKIMIAIEAEGGIYLNDQPVAFKELEARLKELAKDGAGQLVVIQADKETRHGLVVSVLDLAKSAGFEKLAIATVPKSKPEKTE